eukprot:110979_1
MFGSPSLYWFTIALHIFGVCIISFVLLIYITAYSCNQTTKDIAFALKILTIIGTIACSVCTVSNGLTVYINQNSQDFNSIWYNLEAIGHCLNNIMTYTIYIYRLYILFHETAWKISKYTFYILIAFMIIDALDFIVEILAYYYNPSRIIVVDIIGLSSEIIITVMCLWLFNTKLFKLILAIRSTTIDNYVLVNQTSSQRSLNDRQRKLIDRIVRNALLCSITIISWTIERIVWFVFVCNIEDD